MALEHVQGKNADTFEKERISCRVSRIDDCQEISDERIVEDLPPLAAAGVQERRNTFDLRRK